MKGERKLNSQDAMIALEMGKTSYGIHQYLTQDVSSSVDLTLKITMHMLIIWRNGSIPMDPIR
jgi:hypothetical protein